MKKFDLTSFLVENKLTRLGRLSENRYSDPEYFLNGRKIEYNSIVIGNMERYDSPDYSDAYIEDADYEDDGTPLSVEEIEELQSKYDGIVSDLISDKGLYEAENKLESQPIAEKEGMVEPTSEVEEDYSKYGSVEELMKQIETSTNEAAMKHKMERVKKAYESIEAKATSLEEGENASFIAPAKLKEMKRSCKELRNMHERLLKEYDKKYTMKPKKS